MTSVHQTEVQCYYVTTAIRTALLVSWKTCCVITW